MVFPHIGRLGDVFLPLESGLSEAGYRKPTQREFFSPLAPQNRKSPKNRHKTAKTGINMPKNHSKRSFCVLFPRNREFSPRLATLAPFALKNNPAPKAHLLCFVCFLWLPKPIRNGLFSHRTPRRIHPSPPQKITTATHATLWHKVPCSPASNPFFPAPPQYYDCAQS